MHIKEKAVAIDKVLPFALTLAVAFIVPLFHNQLVSGPIINAMLFIAVVMLGVNRAIVISFVPSVIAMSSGLVLMPMVPFIMVSNVIMILVFNFLKDKNYWTGVVISSLMKFIFLYASSFLIIKMVAEKETALSISSMMSWPQLLTALTGGILAYFFLKIIKKA